MIIRGKNNCKAPFKLEIVENVKSQVYTPVQPIPQAGKKVSINPKSFGYPQEHATVYLTTQDPEIDMRDVVGLDFGEDVIVNSYTSTDPAEGIADITILDTCPGKLVGFVYNDTSSDAPLYGMTEDMTFCAAVPAITPPGFLLALISLFGLAAVAMREMSKR